MNSALASIINQVSHYIIISRFQYGVTSEYPCSVCCSSATVSKLYSGGGVTYPLLNSKCKEFCETGVCWMSKWVWGYEPVSLQQFMSTVETHYLLSLGISFSNTLIGLLHCVSWSYINWSCNWRNYFAPLLKVSFIECVKLLYFLCLSLLL